MAETSFGKMIQTLRKEKGVTQEQVAEAMGVSLQAISKWENGSYPNGDILPRLADYFGVSIDYLYGREKRCFFGTADYGSDAESDCGRTGRRK